MLNPKRGCIYFFFFVFIAFIVLFTDSEEEAQGDEVEMHHPRGWQFTMPKGDTAKGRIVFEKFRCYSCHEVRGEKFPTLGRGQAIGPELSQMGPLHPLEYFTESIVNPDATGDKKYQGPDGKSKMPAFNAAMTVQELIDLSSFLASLKPKKVPRTVTAEGKIVAVVPETQVVVVEHGEIKGFMDAMTMGYKINPPSLLKTIKVGDKVRFTMDTDKHVIIKIEKLNN